MTEPFGRLRRFFRGLKRRKVYRVAVVYLVVGFAILEATDIVFPRLGLPSWTVTLVVALTVLGFPLALVLAWAFEVTPDGVRRTEAEPGEPATTSAFQWIGLALVVLVAGGVWYATAGDDRESQSETAASADTAQTTGRPAARSASRHRPFVAALPLENLSPSEENAFFADGIHEEILAQLSKVSGLGVFGRTTMRQYQGTEKTISEIGRELDARAVLEGSVRRAGGRVRITTQLIDPQSRDHLWSETYERELSPETLFEIQADIAGQITSALETELTPSERTRIAEAPTADLAAYDAYLRGRNVAMGAWNFFDPGPLDSAVHHLRDAVRRDSTFAEARAWLGFAYGTRSYFSGEDRWADSAFAATDRALALDSELADARSIKGLLHQVESTQAARDAYRRALELDPNNKLASDGMADLALVEGNYPDAIRWAHRVLRLDPRWEYGRWLMGHILAYVGMLDAGEVWLREVREMNPENPLAMEGLTHVYLSQGEIERAQETVESYRTRRPEHPIGLRLAAEVALHRGQPERAQRLLERVPEARRQVEAPPMPGEEMLLGLAKLRAGDGPAGRTLLRNVADSLRHVLDQGIGDVFEENHLWLARGLSALGQDEAALQHLGVAMERGEVRHWALQADPFFETLRSHPRFREILSRMEAKQQKILREVRQMDIDLYPPGADPDSLSAGSPTDE